MLKFYNADTGDDTTVMGRCLIDANLACSSVICILTGLVHVNHLRPNARTAPPMNTNKRPPGSGTLVGVYL